MADVTRFGFMNAVGLGVVPSMEPQIDLPR